MKLKVLAGLLMTTAALAFSPIEDLNEAVVDLLKPFNNSTTRSGLAFNSLKVDDERALSAGVTASYFKKGSLANVIFNLYNLSYKYESEKGAPLVEFDLGLTTDLRAFISQEDINELGPMVSELVTDMASVFLEDYGAAAEVLVKTLGETYDVDGNLVSIEVLGELKVDLNKLPEGKLKDSVEMTEVKLQLTAGLKGLSGSGYLVMNPAFKAFDEDQDGLKEDIEKLLQQDPEYMRDIHEFIGWIDEVVADLVDSGIF